jgi:tRNA-uridine 2-sulfurtransferase
MRLIARATDASKDQSYMLATVPPALLDRVEFPLGGEEKGEVRAEAARAGLAVAARPESQEACFLAGADYRDFLERQGVQSTPGPIVAEDGRELGRHDGTWRFTPGQRRGIGVAGPEPLYALRSEPATSTLVVGPKGSLATRCVAAEGVLHVHANQAQVKLRYRSDPVPACVEVASGGFVAYLAEPAYGIAPGQLAAVYDGDVVVGAGLITSTTR